MSAPDLAIIAGSGLYELAGIEPDGEARPQTPFGPPSDAIRLGRLAGRRVAFLARHGRAHTLLPSEIAYRANIFALKMLGATRVVSVSAVGSMRETIHPRDVVLVDQFVDRTRGRAGTFFGGGVVAHVAFADPVCPELRGVLRRAALGAAVRAHDAGTYLCIDGPAFSTRAESRLYRGFGVDVIGMTNLPEARLAREAEMCYATLALVTDYDCWHAGEADVSVSGVLENLRINAEHAAGIVARAAAALPAARGGCACGQALDQALITPRAAIEPEVRRRLGPILARCLGDAP